MITEFSSVAFASTREPRVGIGNPSREGLSGSWQIAAILIAAALIMARQPEAIFHSQFYGEDGHVWFADAYNRGWFRSLFLTQDGYYQTLPRLAAALALIWPLRFAPLIMNLVGIGIQLLPIPMVLSSRLRQWGPLSFRILLACFYVALPNSREVNASVTEGQWHLAFVACLLVLGDVPRSRIGRAFDVSVLVLCGLTGPFCIFLLPLALVFWRVHLDRWRGALAAILTASAVLQLTALLFLDSAREHTIPLAPNIVEFIRILGGPVISAAFVGSNMLGPYGALWLLGTIALIGVAVVVFTALHSGREFRLFLAFSTVLLAASLANPKTGAQLGWTTGWQVMAAMAAAHYWFFPTVAILWGIAEISFGPKRTQLSQAVGILLLPLVLVGVMRDWRYSAYPDVNFGYYARRISGTQRGEAIIIPETPPGWSLKLVKK
jgi:hypothetical protein